MNKSKYFSGQPIFSQLLSLISRPSVYQNAREVGTDRYYKKFKTYDHLVTMLYAIFHQCSSLREVTTGMLACQSRLNHLGLIHTPRRSTLADANRKRNWKVFERIYMELYQKYSKCLPDSREEKHWKNKLYIADSTTISLFQEILKNAGMSPVNGKRKGGIKAHTLIKADEDVPCLVRMSAAAAHDSLFLKYINLPGGSIITFDKGYNDYRVFAQWEEQKISWITRLRKATVYEIIDENKIPDEGNVLSDHNIIMGHNHHKKITKVKARLICYYDEENDRVFEFVTNNFDMPAQTIADIYQNRWQIEMLFKRIKQNYPLKYFLGDNENAIRVQIWIALIADLLLKIIKKHLKRPWSYANLSSMIRLHLMTYTNLRAFLENPEKALIGSNNEIRNKTPTLFSV